MARAHEDPFSITAQTEDHGNLCRGCYVSTTLLRKKCHVANMFLGLGPEQATRKKDCTARTSTDPQHMTLLEKVFLQVCTPQPYSQSPW